jgi:CII-binding regulator of phage lambda lysogenization HflD
MQKSQRTQEIKIGKNLDSNQYFNQEFDTYIDDIVSSLGSLPDSVISKTDLRQKVKISTTCVILRKLFSINLNIVLPF